MIRPKKKLSGYRSSDKRKNLWIGLVILVSCIVVWGGLLLLSQSGPRRIKPQPVKDSKTLDKTVTPITDQPQKTSAKELMAASIALEDEARLRMNSGNFEIASGKYEEALRLQKIINRDYPLSQYDDTSRLVRLQLKVKNAAAKPLFLESLECEQQADLFIEAGDLESAEEALSCAIYTQQQLNTEHRDAHQSSTSRLQQLKSRLAELESKRLNLEISALSDHARSLATLEDSEESAKLLQKAALLQEQLNADFPESSYASLTRLSEFRRREQVARSSSFAREVREQSVQLMQSLSKRNTSEAISLLAELKIKLQAFEDMFPLSSLIDEQLKAKIAYLHRKNTQLSVIQDRVYDALIPVPDVEDIQMLNTEVSQLLYVQVMDSNPSRNLSDLNPVDSVSWKEAVAFCERMSWILGKKVRLPTEKEFRKALSDLNSTEAGSLIWSISTATGILQPVGQKKPFPGGYFDLLGNVSEWLASEELLESNTANHIGGNAQDSLEAILEVPVRNLQKAERNRMVGLRIVVRVD